MTTKTSFSRSVFMALFLLILLALPGSIRAQKVSDFDRERGQLMLRVIKDDLKKNYYDEKYHGGFGRTLQDRER